MTEESPILADLNDKQREAVLTTEGPVLVIAGAGSGKTRALAHRVAYLIRERGVSPWNILAVTFTNKAAGEMRERVIRLLGGTENIAELPTIGTFHSTCVRILRKHIHLIDFENNFAIFDDADQLILMKHIFEDLKINEKQLNPRAVLNHISNAKNRLIGPEKFAQMADSYFAEKVARLYFPYCERLKKNNALDFDDLLMKTIELFKLHAPVLDKYSEKFRYIHIDEYQDTNYAQYVFTNLLAAKYRNLYVIGDYDQAIYNWRGATVQNILDFEKDYPEAKIIKMEQNYRSTQQILDAAHAVIIKNKKRKEKRLWTERGDGELIKLLIAENERHEGELVACAIRDEVRSHELPDYRDFVVLYRVNAQSRPLEEVFIRYGIPYKIIGGIRFYERKEIKDMVAYLRVIANPANTVSLLRIINIPQRNIGPKTLEKIQTFANIKDCGFFEAMMRCGEIPDLAESKREHIEKFVKLIKRLQKHNNEMRAAALIKFVLDETGYKKYLDDGSIEGEARLENVAELISVATKYDKLEPGMSLNIFLEEISLIADIDKLDEKDNAVTFMTLHSAKGLEFPWVFICGLEEGLLPHSRSLLSPEEIEEERRLFYVGCTRAMDRLHLLYAKNRMLYGESQNVIPSQFLEDIPAELIDGDITLSLSRGAPRNLLTRNSILRPSRSSAKPASAQREREASGSAGAELKKLMPSLGWATLKKPIPLEKPLQEFSAGDRVNHRIFGEGMVVSTNGGIITVVFKDPKIGIKKLAVTIAPLEKI